MEIKSQSQDVMFLFGAGISIPIGIPCMTGVYDLYVNNRKHALPPKHKKLCKFFTENMGIPKDLEEFLLAANTIIEFRGSGLNKFIEKNISKIESSSKIKEYNNNLEEHVNEIIEIKEGILDLLAKTCFQFDRAKALKINKGFVNVLSKLRYSVFSTNYDFAFEDVATETGIKIIDNFTTNGQRQIWNDKISFEGNNGFKLIKLHGSVTWYTDESGTIEKIPLRTNINSLGKDINNIVIFPTRFKDIYSQHFFALYSYFLNSLSSAKVIFIAGHSLRDDYLRAGIIERHRKGDFQIVVIDPTYPEIIKQELQPSRLGTSGDIIHLPYKWEDFSDELSYILLNYPFDQLAKKCNEFLRKQKSQKNRIAFKGNIGTLRTNEKKELSIEIKVLLPPDRKRVNLRAWLEATYNEADGTTVNKYYNEFIEENVIQFGNDLTRSIDTVAKLKIKIPKVQKWIDVGCKKVTLKVALLNTLISKPQMALILKPIISIEKQLDYKT